MTSCHACGSKTVEQLIDVGRQPICNRFLSDAAAPQYSYPMVVGQCDACRLVQISDPVPAREVLPRFDWITYNEPEPHLDAVVERIARLPGVGKASRICGVSFKDDSTLARFERLGFGNTWRIDPAADLGIREAGIGVETIQDRLTPQTAARLREKRGVSDVVIVRHIVEHAHDLRGFMAALKGLVSPTGYVVLEAPDCERAFERHEFTTLWEEHIVYFTPETYRRTLANCGFALVDFVVYPYPFENSLVAIARPDERAVRAAASPAPAAERARFHKFAQALPEYGEKIRRYLEDYRRRHGKIALFGAGHLAATYVNIFRLTPLVEFVVDDNPNKQGMFMPGSALPIRGSAALVEENIKLCLLGLSPQSEDKVVAKQGRFVERGGTFASIFATSARALPV
jgi:hypothetical protein